MLVPLLILALPLASAFFPARRMISRDLAMMARKKSDNLPLVDRLPIIEPAIFKKFELTESLQLTRVCQSLRSMTRVRISDNPVLEALCTDNGQSIFGEETFCSDVLFIRDFYEQLFQKIRRTRRVVLTGNPGVSKSV